MNLFDVSDIFDDHGNISYGVKRDFPSLNYWRKAENGYVYAYVISGVDEKDLTLEFGEPGEIRFFGKSEYECYDYMVDERIYIPNNIEKNIKEITYKVKNGILYIYLELEKVNKKNIIIKKIN